MRTYIYGGRNLIFQHHFNEKNYCNASFDSISMLMPVIKTAM
jgi:cysteinyl-tRNA synthetase